MQELKVKVDTSCHPIAICPPKPQHVSPVCKPAEKKMDVDDDVDLFGSDSEVRNKFRKMKKNVHRSMAMKMFLQCRTPDIPRFGYAILEQISLYFHSKFPTRNARFIFMIVIKISFSSLLMNIFRAKTQRLPRSERKDSPRITRKNPRVSNKFQCASRFTSYMFDNFCFLVAP